jgi:hypothetical protein
MIYVFTIIGLLMAVLAIGKINLTISFRNDVKKLFSESKNISAQHFKIGQLEGLPEPVIRYFNLVLKDNQPYISYARMKHKGQFKAGIDKDWMDIVGEQYATTEKPGFIWNGTTSLFVARDLYISDSGRLIVTLMSIYNIINAKGPEYDEGELLRWLGESVMYPTNFLPDERLKWFPIDANSAKLIFDYKGLSLFFYFSFNEKGEITEMETQRFMSEESRETWVIKVRDYKEWNKVVIPTSFEVLWRLKTGDFSYAKFKITEVEYEKPTRF